MGGSSHRRVQASLARLRMSLSAATTVSRVDLAAARTSPQHAGSGGGLGGIHDSSGTVSVLPSVVNGLSDDGQGDVATGVRRRQWVWDGAEGDDSEQRPHTPRWAPWAHEWAPRPHRGVYFFIFFINGDEHKIILKNVPCTEALARSECKNYLC